MITRQWYVIRTGPHAEYLAAAALERSGFELFFPRVKTVHPRMGHTDVPLFPGYLFLRFDPQEGWPSLQQIPYVSGWVRFQGVVPSVSDEVVAQLVHQVAVINSEGGLWTRFRPGERVRVVSRVMERVAEVVEEARSPQAQVRVLLEFMGRLVPARVSWQHLQPMKDAPPVLVNKDRAPRRTRGRGRWVQGFGPGTQAVAQTQATDP